MTPPPSRSLLFVSGDPRLAATLVSLGHDVLEDRASLGGRAPDLVILAGDALDEAPRWRDAGRFVVAVLGGDVPEADGYLVPGAPEVVGRQIEALIRQMHLSEALDAAQARRRTIFGQNTDAILVLSRDGRIKFANAPALGLFGRDVVGEVFEGGLAVGSTSDFQLSNGTLVQLLVVETEWERAPALLVTMRDVSRRNRVEAFKSAQSAIVERIASGAPLADVLRATAELVEAQKPGISCSILMLEDGRLRHGAAPSLPRSLVEGIDGSRVGPATGSCGTAAFEGRTVIVEDIDTHPYWDAYRHLTAPHDLRSCWSMPILSRSGVVLGTFAVYAKQVRGPDLEEMEIVAACSHIAGIAIERQRDIEALAASERSYRSTSEELARILDMSLDVICTFDEDGRFVQVSAASADVLGYRPEQLLGRRFAEIFEPLAADDGDPDRPFGGRSTRGFIQSYRRPDGSLVDVMWSAHWSQQDHLVYCVARDITEPRRSARALENFFDLSNECMCIASLDGYFIRVNAAFRSALGWPPEELLATPFLDLVHPDDRLATLSTVEQLAVGVPTANMVNRYRRKDGEYRTFRWSVHPVPQESVLYAVAHDITEETRVRAVLEETAERNRQLARRLTTTLESITDAFVTVDREWRFTYVNRQAERLLSRRRGSLLGRVLWDEFEAVAGSPFDRAFRTALDTGRSAEFEEFYRPLDMWFDVRAYPSDEGLAIYFRDTTERKRVNDRLVQQASLLDKAQDAIMVRDLSHRILFWNKGAERIYGYTAEEAVGRSVAELLYHDTTAYFSAFEHAIEKGEWIGELEQIHRDGRVIIIQGRWTIVRDNPGQPVLLAINTDITEKARLEQQFLRAQRLESIGTLAGGIAHDLNNVLAPIILSADLLALGVTDPENERLIAAISSSAKRGAEMVSQVLSFARGMDGRRVQVHVRHLVDDVERIVRDTFPKNIRLETRIPAELWTTVGDPTQLHQVLLNLCVNARDAMPGGGRLSLSAENVMLDEAFAAANIDATAGAHVAIDVEDTGTGISPSILDKIFDPFFTTKEVGKGTGLGLSTSAAIVKSHGGFLRVYSEVGVGSRFRLYLPAEWAVRGIAAVDGASPPPRGNGETVLVVDDEASVREITGRTLEAFGYRAMTAADGAEAVALYAEHRASIAVVITDMMMPVMDGQATIQVLTRMNPKIRIIAASGIGANGQVARAAAGGVRHFLAKPYTAETLLAVLARVLAEN